MQNTAHAALNSLEFVFLSYFFDSKIFSWQAFHRARLFNYCLYLLNCSEIPTSDKWWTLLLCTSQNTPTSESPDVLLPFKTWGFPLPLWNSQCHSQYANANTRDSTNSNVSWAKLASIADGRRWLLSKSHPVQLFSAAAQVKKRGERSPAAVKASLCQCTPGPPAIPGDKS